MRVAFRVDGNSTIGLGHITRCLALANELKKYGAVHFISRPLAVKIPFVVHELPANADRRTDIELTRSFLAEIGPDVVIVDHHDLDQRYLDNIKAFSGLLVTIDDLKREICSDIVVNVNCFSLKMKYRCRSGKVFLGPRYSLVRKTPQRKSVGRKAGKILVSMGGADVLNLTPKVVGALKLVRGVKVTVVIGPAFSNEREIRRIAGDDKFSLARTRDLPALMLKHDAAICGGGTTLYELAATGTPAIILCQAENQFINAGELDGKTLISLGMGDRASTDKIKSAVEQLIGSYALRKKFSRNGKKLVDCKGPQRVAALIMNELPKRRITLQPAKPSDSRLVWKLRNGKTTRENSFNTAAIPFVEHKKWFRDSLKSGHRKLYIIRLNSKRIGYVRLDIDGASEISLALNRRCRGMGIGPRAIALGCRLAKGDVIARIKPGNEASIKAFERAGFTISGRDEKSIKMKLINFHSVS